MVAEDCGEAAALGEYTSCGTRGVEGHWSTHVTEIEAARSATGKLIVVRKMPVTVGIRARWSDVGGINNVVVNKS